MARLRYNGLTATLGADLASGDTTITFAAPLTSSAGAVPTLTSGDTIALSLLDAGGAVAEIVSLTAYTAGATTGTITRAQESTTAVAHASGDAVVHSATAADFVSSGGGGGGAAQVFRSTLAADFTSTVGSAWTQITGLTFSVTPTANSVLMMGNSRLRCGHSQAGASLFVRAVISPTPTSGGTLLASTFMNANGLQTYNTAGAWVLAASTTYTVTAQFYSNAVGTFTCYGVQEDTELCGVLLPV